MAVGFELNNQTGTIKYNGVDVLNVARAPKLGGVCLVDSINGNDSTGVRGGLPFLTVGAALSAAQSGDCVLILPGTYNLGSGIVIPSGVAIRGVSVASVVLQSLNVSTNSVLVTMGNNSRLEDVTLKLTSTGHYGLTGIDFPGTTSATAKLRTLVITVDNSSASNEGTSNVYGINVSGTGQPAPEFQAIRACMSLITSAGQGNKRALYVGTAAKISARDSNFRVARQGTGTGLYVAIETNHANAEIYIHSTYIDGFSADISQTLGKIELGATNLAHSTASGKGFVSTLPAVLMAFGDSGAAPSGATRYLRPGTSPAASSEIKLRIHQKCIMQELVIRAITPPGVGKTDTFTIRKNGVDTLLSVSLSDNETSKVLSNVSVNFASGDDLSVKLVTSNATGLADFVLLFTLY